MKEEEGGSCRAGRLTGITPLFSNFSFFITGLSVSFVYIVVTVVARDFADSLGINLELSNHSYLARQVTVLFAVLGISTSLLTGLAGRMSYVASQCMLWICYFTAASYVRAHAIDLHLRVIMLLRFIAAVAFISGMTQTCAVYCMTDASMPGGFRSITVRATSFFLGCAMSGPSISYLFVVNKALQSPDGTTAALHNQFRHVTSISYLCVLAGVVAMVGSILTGYMIVNYNCRTCMDRVSWFPFFTSSYYDISADSIKTQVSHVYLPLLWTSNPLFVVFATSVILNSSVSSRLLFIQFVIYAICAMIPVVFLGTCGTFGFTAAADYIMGDDQDCMYGQHRRMQVLKTVDMNDPDDDDVYPFLIKGMLGEQ
ncbi:hypothetical protein BgAZ_105660 [Babesia gibsoni]|uniref:Uncharacterized protein n=1 Tax=Babesia gibsoni TaxID=33632 RepID=A0AAD8PFS8_BABGI|nr:hypothetical protein BgAZ_105660 [Babesia gibsoni]